MTNSANLLKPRRSIINQQFTKYNYLCAKAAKTWYRRYSCTGSMTYEDFYQEACLGLLAGLRHLETKDHPNPTAYLASFCGGYITHAVHRKSRMIRPSYQQIKEGLALGHASLEHLDLDLGAETPLVLEEDIQEFFDTLEPRHLTRYKTLGTLPPRLQKVLNALIAKYND